MPSMRAEKSAVRYAVVFLLQQDIWAPNLCNQLQFARGLPWHGCISDLLAISHFAIGTEPRLPWPRVSHTVLIDSNDDGQCTRHRPMPHKPKGRGNALKEIVTTSSTKHLITTSNFWKVLATMAVTPYEATSVSGAETAKIPACCLRVSFKPLVTRLPPSIRLDIPTHWHRTWHGDDVATDIPCNWGRHIWHPNVRINTYFSLHHNATSLNKLSLNRSLQLVQLHVTSAYLYSLNLRSQITNLIDNHTSRNNGPWNSTRPSQSNFARNKNVRNRFIFTQQREMEKDFNGFCVRCHNNEFWDPSVQSFCGFVGTFLEHFVVRRYTVSKGVILAEMYLVGRDPGFVGLTVDWLKGRLWGWRWTFWKSEVE